ncbi:MAG: HPF/RaiA family ribosome-associated protein [Myxococcales bacterium]|nr:HPF/RaiA family ribosome-associated protein [Myxococcales bacterium]
MSIPLELTFRDMPPSDAVATAIRDALDRLAKVSDRLQRCVAVVERPHQSQRHGQAFHVRLELVVPDRVVTVAHDPGDADAHENVYAAIADAFRAARRQLQDHAEIQRGDVKTHAG